MVEERICPLFLTLFLLGAESAKLQSFRSNGPPPPLREVIGIFLGVGIDIPIFSSQFCPKQNVKYLLFGEKYRFETFRIVCYRCK